MTTRTLIFSGLGTNCDQETAYACTQAGSNQVDFVHMHALYHEKIALGTYGLLIFQGGFLDGDELGGARACANRFRHRKTPHNQTVFEALVDFIHQGGLVLGICNGFQLLTRLGLLPNTEGKTEQNLSLAHNLNGRYENRWVSLGSVPHSPCLFTQGLTTLRLPVRHGEGRVQPRTPALPKAWMKAGLVPLYYQDTEGNPTETYPDNPNGSPLGIAALCNPQGTVMGLMPHPEGFSHPTQSPFWLYEKTEAQGLALFRNAYRHLG